MHNKIASGPMTGQELMINTDNNLIIIGDSLDYKTDINDDGFTTYQILVMVLPVSFLLLQRINILKVV